VSANPALTPDDAPDAKTRRCWRCLQQFPLDPDEIVTGPAQWWVCEPCHTSLLGQKRR
jgi:hypothetical protein